MPKVDGKFAERLLTGSQSHQRSFCGTDPKPAGRLSESWLELFHRLGKLVRREFLANSPPRIRK